MNSKLAEATPASGVARARHGILFMPRETTDELATAHFRTHQNPVDVIAIHLGFGTSLTDLAFQNVSAFPNIEELDLSGMTNLTKVGLQCLLAAFKDTLKTLRISNCPQITDADLVIYVGSFTILERLDLSDCTGFTDAGLTALPRTLQELVLSGTNVTSAGLRYVAALPALHTLNLAWCARITDHGLDFIAAMSKLRDLSLRGNDNITNAGLLLLYRLSELHTICLSSCKHVTDLTIEMLFTRLPNLQNIESRLCSATYRVENRAKVVLPFILQGPTPLIVRKEEKRPTNELADSETVRDNLRITVGCLMHIAKLSNLHYLDLANLVADGQQ